MRKQTVKSARLFVEDDQYFLDVLYEIENDHYVKECHIPKVRLPIEHGYLSETQTTLSSSTRFDPAKIPYPDVDLVLPYRELTAYPVETPESPESKVFYTVKIIKEKRKKMTKEEIEKALGYKIDIV